MELEGGPSGILLLEATEPVYVPNTTWLILDGLEAGNGWETGERETERRDVNKKLRPTWSRGSSPCTPRRKTFGPSSRFSTKNSIASL
jgi:hypothetical protein